ncbi:hypothetical protein BKA56DRAFT_608153 [Ilyonectria sp. MPI-CAGE-AT-0026]|nr:hypothetical protein BKA56DRAFT_608153 [Ilyonectria sp. MPI-CAGE-AT-0026]
MANEGIPLAVCSPKSDPGPRQNGRKSTAERMAFTDGVSIASHGFCGGDGCKTPFPGVRGSNAQTTRFLVCASRPPYQSHDPDQVAQNPRGPAPICTLASNPIVFLLFSPGCLGSHEHLVAEAVTLQSLSPCPFPGPWVASGGPVYTSRDQLRQEIYKEVASCAMSGISDEKKKFGKFSCFNQIMEGALGIQSAGRLNEVTDTAQHVYVHAAQAGGESPQAQGPAHTKFCAWLIPVPLAWGGGPAAIVSWILAS